MKTYRLTLAFALMVVATTLYAQYDDIYFDPKTDIKVVKIATKNNTLTQTTVVEETVLTDGISLTEEDYTYSSRLNRFHNQNLLVHINDNDTTIYDIENGRYLVTFDNGDIDFEAYNESENRYINNYYVDYGYGWNNWYGYWYDPFYYNWGWRSYYNTWAWGYYAWHDPWHYYHPYYHTHCHHHAPHNYYGHVPSKPHQSDVRHNYTAASNETYRLQHNNAGRYSGTRQSATQTVGNGRGNAGERTVVAGTRQGTQTGNSAAPRQQVTNGNASSANRASQTVRVQNINGGSRSNQSGVQSQTTRSSSSSSSNVSSGRSGNHSSSGTRVSGSQGTGNSGSRSGSYSGGSSSGGSRSGSYSGGSSSGGSRGGGSSSGSTRR